MLRLPQLMIACCLLAVLGQVSASPIPSVPAQAQVIALLIEQLGSDDYSEREAASASLEKIGAPAASALRNACRSESLEIRKRAGLLLKKWQLITDSAKCLEPRRVKLAYRDVALGTAVNDLRTRTGLNFELDPNRVANPLRPITCVTEEIPVWEALERFCIAADLQEEFLTEIIVPRPPSKRGYVTPVVQPGADGVPIKLVDGKPQRLPGDRSTAVRVLALPPSFPGHRVNLGSGETTLCLDVTPVPGIGWKEVTDVKILMVIDNAGRAGHAGVDRSNTWNAESNEEMSFAPPGLVAFRINEYGNPVYPESMVNPRIVPVPLRVSTLSAKSLKRLEGVVFAEVQLPNEQLISVGNLARHVNENFFGPGDVRFCILNVKPQADARGKGSIQVQLQYPSPWLVNLVRRWGGWNPWPQAPLPQGEGIHVEAYDARGDLFPVVSKSAITMSDDGYLSYQTIDFSYDADRGLPAQLKVIGPKPVQVQIPFALENIKLP